MNALSDLSRPVLYLVDGTALLFRAYYGYPKSFNAIGEPIGGVSGFFRMLHGLLHASGMHRFGVAFDTGKTTFREKLRPEYKAHRPPLPDDLKPQFAHVEKLCKALEIPLLQTDGYEADDVMASYAQSAVQSGYHVVLVASDKDLHQMISNTVHVYDPGKRQMLQRQDVREKWGVDPEQMVELQMLMGDAADGIPGVAGIGPKTAARLLQAHGSLDGIYCNLSQIDLRWHERLLAYRPHLAVVRRLVTLVSDLVLPHPITTLPSRLFSLTHLHAFLHP